MKAFDRTKPKNLRREIARLYPEVAQELHQKLVTRTQYFMLLAFNRALGIGPKRFGRVLEEYGEIAKWYEEAAKDGVEEELLLRELRKIGVDVEKLY